MPASPIHVALFLVELLESGATYSVVCNIVCSLKWAHDMNGRIDPTNNAFVKNLVESAKRHAKPVRRRKEPVTKEMLISLCGKFKDSNGLMTIRDLTMILLAFSSFLRFDELSQLRCKDIIVKEDHLCIKIGKSKTDQYRDGDEILVSKGSSEACPYLMFLRYAQAASLDLSTDMYLFRPLYRSKKKCVLVKQNKPISYTTARECFLRKLKAVAPGLHLGLHSLRAGGATAAANSGVSDRCWKRHGRWKSDSSKDGYVKDSIENRLKVSKNLGL